MQIKGLVKKDPSLNKASIFLSYNNGNKNLEVRISPYFGSNIYKFKYNGFDIFYSNLRLLKKRGWTGCFILWPYPNRVRNKKFIFEGKTYDLTGIRRLSGNYHLIHGLVDDQIWQVGKIVKENESVQASTFIDIKASTPMYAYFPFESRLTLEFVLDEHGLKVKYTIENHSNKNFPFGFALHPYFSLLSDSNATLIKLPAKSIMEADYELLPTGKRIDLASKDYNLNNPVPVSKLSLDHVFTNLAKSHVPYIDYVNQHLRIKLESSEDFTHIVLYTKEKSSVCMENQTGSVDMINLHTQGVKEHNSELIKLAHLLMLPPGKKHSGYVYYKIEEY